MWEASSRTIRKYRLALVKEARSLGYTTPSSELYAKFLKADNEPPHRCLWAHIARKQVLARESHGA